MYLFDSSRTTPIGRRSTLRLYIGGCGTSSSVETRHAASLHWGLWDVLVCRDAACLVSVLPCIFVNFMLIVCRFGFFVYFCKLDTLCIGGVYYYISRFCGCIVYGVKYIDVSY